MPQNPPGADGPLIPKGAVMFQVAAVLRQDDALALAQALQQKKFPAFVIPPSRTSTTAFKSVRIATTRPRPVRGINSRPRGLSPSLSAEVFPTESGSSTSVAGKVPKEGLIRS